MKIKKWKPLKLSVVISCLALLLFNCNYDDGAHAHQHENAQTSNKLKVTRIKFNEISKNKYLVSNLNKVKEKSFNGIDKTGKMVSAINYDFTINTDYANYIENENGSHSYTFKVIRENPEFLLENLVMASKNDSSGGYNLYLTQYTITPEEYDAFKAGENPNFENSVTLVKLVEDGLVDAILNKETIDIQSMCMQSNIIPGNTCPSGQHTYLNAIECEYLNFTFYAPQTTYSWESCTVTVEVDTGSGGGSTGGGGTNGDPTDPTDDYDPTDPNIHGNGSVDTLPTDEMPLEEVNEPCDNIKNGTSSAAYKQKFKDLNKPEKFNDNKESGFAQVEINGQDQYIDGTTSNDHQLIINSNSKNGTHVHNNKPKIDKNNVVYDAAIKIQSPGDLKSLLESCQVNSSPNEKEAFVVMLSDEGIFAITIINPLNDLTTFNQNYLQIKKEFKKNSGLILFDPDLGSIGRKKALTKMLLRLLKDYGLENHIGLFEGSIENDNATNINDYKINWDRKKLRKGLFGYSVENSPCN